MYNNKKNWFLKELKFIIFFLAGILLLGLVVMSLWNAILPAVLHVSVISFGQALGILVLSKILFGGFGGRGWRRPGKMNYMQQKLANMTPEEREKFKVEWRNRCSKWGQKDFARTPSDTAGNAE